jgi:hypothetical protein
MLITAGGVRRYGGVCSVAEKLARGGHWGGKQMPFASSCPWHVARLRSSAAPAAARMDSTAEQRSMLWNAVDVSRGRKQL